MGAITTPAFAVAVGLVLALFEPASESQAQGVERQGPFWDAREAATASPPEGARVRIGIWDSGVDLSLFEDRLARDENGEPLVRGYDAFKLRQDTPLAVLPHRLMGLRDNFNWALVGFDDLDGGVESQAAGDITAYLAGLDADQSSAFMDDVGLWSGYAHGTGVADIATSSLPGAEIVVARMEWWHGSPPVPCWSRELADREAQSMGDLLAFLVNSGVRVVNMSWGRFETSYISNLEACAPEVPEAERRALARYTVEAIRQVLRDGMAAAPQVLFVAAAGNAGSSLDVANPATRFEMPNLILVGAVDRQGQRTDYTNTGPEVALYANGDRVPGRLPGGRWSTPTGTSMATPNVTNTAARMLVVNPDLSGAELRQLLEETADPNATGQMLLHPARAVAAARRRAEVN